MVSFENFVKSMPLSLSELKVTPNFCFPFKIPDDLTATNLDLRFFFFNRVHEMCRLNFFLPFIAIGNPAKDIKLTLKAGLIRHSLTKSTYNDYVSCPKFQLLF